MPGPVRGRIAIADRETLSRAIARAYGPALAGKAAYSLARRRPRLSAADGACRSQSHCRILAAGCFAQPFICIRREAVAVYGAALSLMFLVTIALRLAAAVHAAMRHLRGGRRPGRRPREFELPNYTVLVAMYRE